MLPIIVAGSRPAATVLVQRRHFDCDTSVDLLRLLHARITETPRSRVSFASTVLLNPIGSLRPSHAQKPNRHRARGTALRILSRDFLLWRFSDAGPSRSVRGAVRHRPASENLHKTGSDPVPCGVAKTRIVRCIRNSPTEPYSPIPNAEHASKRNWRKLKAGICAAQVSSTPPRR
jgi:hypothetical protein